MVLLLQQTIFTSPAVAKLLAFDPSLAFQRPWTFVTYMFVHAGILHLAVQSLALFVFGPLVEQRMGSTGFLVYYLYCGIGAAIFSLVLSGVMPVAPFIGASGAIMGVAYAFARFAPDAELMVFPVPVPIKAKVLVWLFVAFEIFGALSQNDDIAHLAHLGGLGAGMLFFLLQGIGRSPVSQRVTMTQPRVPVPARGESAARRAAAAAQPKAVTSAPAAPAVRTEAVDEAAEIDRVLDKISALGVESLTAEERRFLGPPRSGVAPTPTSGMISDLVSPWCAAVEAGAAPGAEAAFRRSHAPLLDRLGRQRNPLGGTLPRATDAASLRKAGIVARDPALHRTLRDVLAKPAAKALTGPDSWCCFPVTGRALRSRHCRIRCPWSRCSSTETAASTSWRPPRPGGSPP